MTTSRRSLDLTSCITAAGELVLSIVEVDLPAPKPDEVVVQVKATPINPSDLGLLLGPADLSSLQAMAGGLVTTANIPPRRMGAMAARLGQAMRVGNEGAGVVVEAGANAQALLGKTVAMVSGAMYAQYRLVKASEAVPLPEGVTAAQGASAFVNPLTALGMVETMKREGHQALVHTAAASNLGQMLNRICIKDGIALVNIVRSAEQVKVLRDLGAVHVLDSTADDSKTPSLKLWWRQKPPLPSTPSEAARWQTSSSAPWKRRSIAPRPATAAMARSRTSRSTFMECSTYGRPSSTAATASPGAWPAGS